MSENNILNAPSPEVVRAWKEKAELIEKDDLSKVHVSKIVINKPSTATTVIAAIIAISIAGMVGYFTFNYTKEVEKPVVSIKQETKIIPPVQLALTVIEPVKSEVPIPKKKVYAPKKETAPTVVAKKQSEQLPTVIQAPSVPVTPDVIATKIEVKNAEIDKIDEAALSKFEIKMQEFERKFK